jgi:hypothetical protein
MEPRYRVVSFGSFQTGDTDGLLEHGQFDDVKEAVRMAQVVVESSLRHAPGHAVTRSPVGTGPRAPRQGAADACHGTGRDQTP